MSERKIVEYIFLYGDPSLISGLINDYINIGYVPYGSPNVCRGTIGQAMIKYED